MARLLKKPLIIALAAVILLVIGFFAYIQNAFTGTRCEAAKHLDADMIGDCYGCHLKVTPQVAQDWYESKHGVTLVRCQVCHGQPDGKGAVPFKRVPGVEVCAACHGLAIDKMLRQEYYLPKSAQYEIREGNVSEITVYDVPSTGDNNGYYTFKRTYGNGVTLMAGEEKNLDPIYLLEGKYSDHTAGTGENGVPLNYSMNMSLAEVGGEPQKNEYLTNLPQLPRNTHVVVHAIIRGNSEISWTVDVVPYGQAILEPIFGL